MNGMIEVKTRIPNLVVSDLGLQVT